MFDADTFQRFCAILQLKKASNEPILLNVTAITFFCMSVKYSVSS